ncbi:proprotein convertase P-domain-containing protein [Actinokineospora sp. 24-640]
MAAYQSNGQWARNPYLVYENGNPIWQPGSREGDSWRNNCHDALASPVHSVPSSAVPGGTKVVNLACSGAKSKNLWPREDGGEFYNDRRPQIEDLALALGPGTISRAPDDAELIVIGAGGNDSGFGEAIRYCLTAWAKKHIADIAFPPVEQKCRDQVRDNLVPKVSDIHYNTVKTIGLVREKMRAEGQPDNSYRIVLQGYPAILPTEVDDWTADEGAGFDKRCPITKEDSRFINTHFVTRLNEMLRAASEEANVGFIDMADAFEGHRLCEKGTVRGTAAAQSASHAEWVRFLDIHPNASSAWKIIKAIAHPTTGHWPLSEDDVVDALNPQRHLSESFHPNYWGQQAIGRCLRVYHLTTTGQAKAKCRNGGGQAGLPEQMTLSGLGPVPGGVDNPAPDLAIPQSTGMGPNPMVRTIVVPESAKPGHYVQPFLDIAHPRKGQLKVSLVDPQGRSRLLYDFSGDTGGALPGRWTYDYFVWDPWVVKDPSGTWKLIVWDGTVDGFQGTLRGWDLKFY